MKGKVNWEGRGGKGRGGRERGGERTGGFGSSTSTGGGGGLFHIHWGVQATFAMYLVLSVRSMGIDTAHWKSHRWSEGIQRNRNEAAALILSTTL
jgi:hypothetical protein